MAGMLDLDAIVVETTEIAKTIDGKRRVWALRDDIPPEIMLQCFRLMGHAELQSGAVSELRATMDTDDPASVVSAVETLEQTMLAQAEEVTHICGNIFRHSYPETTDDEMRRWFRDDERIRIVQLFFTRRLQASSTLSADTTATPTPNRQQRRSAGQNSRRSSGAIPSQKRLSRELKGL